MHRAKTFVGMGPADFHTWMDHLSYPACLGWHSIFKLMRAFGFSPKKGRDVLDHIYARVHIAMSIKTLFTNDTFFIRMVQGSTYIS